MDLGLLYLQSNMHRNVPKYDVSLYHQNSSMYEKV